MARTVKDYMDFVANVIANIPNQTERIIKQNETTILDLNRQEQLYKKGIDSLGLELKPYAVFTIEIKQMLGQPYDRTTLNYSGSFYDGFFLKYDKNNFTLEFNSTDEKTPELIGKYRENIFGLTRENQRKLNYEIIKPELDKYIKQWL